MMRSVFERQEQLHLHCRMKTYLFAATSIHLGGPGASRNLLLLHGSQPTAVFQGLLTLLRGGQSCSLWSLGKILCLR